MTYKTIAYYTLFLALLVVCSVPATGQDRILQVTGKVTDELDRTLPGASIKIAGTKIMAITGNDGAYRIMVSPLDSLEFSFTGYKTEVFAVRNRVDLSVRLTPVAGGLNEVTVIGYGQQKK
ncbi:carboxypeptidase-like regulatory domain-containing protein [Paraflavitalea speifideaquila]|uniref:carboxypeptidase-like regulatory domain-containing protein n=1 Tax=Paraflavitalea speifideaquila TaxID=3076558 RepID=UPI0028E930A0|nr:carboxypeptidase-like regulatory domain-containing protein [Paraflavitalea speifideiaquila]